MAVAACPGVCGMAVTEPNTTDALAFESRGYREAATLLTELGLWDCGAPAEVLIGVVAASWLKGVRDGMADVVRELRVAERRMTL